MPRIGTNTQLMVTNIWHAHYIQHIHSFKESEQHILCANVMLKLHYSQIKQTKVFLLIVRLCRECFSKGASN